MYRLYLLHGIVIVNSSITTSLINLKSPTIIAPTQMNDNRIGSAAKQFHHKGKGSLAISIGTGQLRNGHTIDAQYLVADAYSGIVGRPRPHCIGRRGRGGGGRGRREGMNANNPIVLP